MAGFSSLVKPPVQELLHLKVVRVERLSQPPDERAVEGDAAAERRAAPERLPVRESPDDPVGQAAAQAP